MPKRVHTEKTNIRGGVDALRAIRNPLSTSRIGAKKYAALALCVSLWIAGGSVAWAENWTADITIKDTTTNFVISGEVKDSHVIPFPSSYPLPIYRTTLEGVHVKVDAYGGAYGGSTSVNNNAIILKGTQVDNLLCGGYGVNGSTQGNRVTAINSIIGAVYGGNPGEPYDKDATENSIILVNSSVVGTITSSCDIYGGRSTKNSVNNKVTLQDVSVKGSVFGGFNNSTSGNLLNLFYGTKTTTVGGAVKFFDKIVLQDSFLIPDADKAGIEKLTLQWTPGATLLSANQFMNVKKLDISGAKETLTKGSGAMTLVHSETGCLGVAVDVLNKLIGFDGTEKELTPGASIQVFAQNDMETTENGVTLVYDTTQAVKLDADAKNITYNIENAVRNVGFGEVAWSAGGTARTLTAGGLHLRREYRH